MNTIWSDFARMVYNVEIEIEGENGDRAGAIPSSPGASGPGVTGLSYSGGTLDDQPSAYGEVYEDDEVAEPAPVEQRKVEANEAIGRNEPCWCGSQKKFKKCHGA